MKNLMANQEKWLSTILGDESENRAEISHWRVEKVENQR